MLESLYERSMRAGGGRHARRMLVISLAAALAVVGGLAMVPVHRLEQLEGEVVPAVARMVSVPEDGWVELAGGLEGRRVEADDALGWWWPEHEMSGSRAEGRPLTAGMTGVVLAFGGTQASGGSRWKERGSVIAEVYDPDRLVVRIVLERGRRLEAEKVGRVILQDRAGSGRHPATVARHFLSRGIDGGLDQVLELDPGSTDGFGLLPGQVVSVRLVLGTERLWRRSLDLVVGR